MMKIKNDDKQSKPQNQEQKLKEKDEKHEEMSIDSGIPDLENEAKDQIKLRKKLKLKIVQDQI